MKLNQSYYNFLIYHLVAIACVCISLLSGLRIRLVSDVNLHWLSPILPQGEMHTFHIYAALGITALAVSYFIYSLHNKREADNGYHLWVNRFGHFALLGAIITGWLKYFQTSAWFIPSAHFIFCLLLIVFLLLHSYVHIIQLGAGVFSRILPLRVFKHARFTAATALLITIAAGLVVTENIARTRTLVVTAIDYQQFIDIDGYGNEAFWQQASSVKVFTSGGANFINGSTEIEVKAVANPSEVYFLFRWQDSSQSLAHMPLLKQNGQWIIKQNGFYQFDEQTYYEDKFAVIVSESCGLGADNTAKLGPKPLKDKPENFHKKGFHASTDGKIRDLWHWKAVRTNDMFLADDNHISKAKTARTAQRRYTAGYTPDGKESGAYVMNWQWYKPSEITPKRLPVESALLQSYQNDTSWILPWFESKPYSKIKDTYKNGTLLPSVLYRSNRFEGDRADIRARGKWQNGYWTLELARKRDTGSKHDVPLKDDVCLWTSAFDHSQIAHTRHERPLQLEFAQL